jgi:predicted acetyltransferase
MQTFFLNRKGAKEHAMKHYDSGPLQDEEVAHYATILAQSLHFTSNTEDWIRNSVGIGECRVVRSGGRVVAGMANRPMGQWFGGRSVRTAGIAAVGVAIEERGKGVASAMMRDALMTYRDQGYPISTLYPATTTLYRRAGYERAGQYLQYETPIDAVSVNERELTAQLVHEDGHEPFAPLYEQVARAGNGNLDRPPVMWQRVINPRHEAKPYRYLILRDEQPEGYVVFRQGERFAPITIVDYAALTGAAARRILTLLGDHRSMISAISWHGAPHDPLAFALPEQRAEVKNTLDWMVRILDAPAALTARGYDALIATEVHLRLHDDLLSNNEGNFVLSVSGGAARVNSGGSGSIELHIRGLAALYSGYLNSHALHLLGLIEGPREECARLDTIFRSPPPWMLDMF